MASVTLAKQFTKDLDLDGSLKNRAWDFVRKVMTDPAAPGLHIEPIVGSRDPRVRTGRVNDGYRAVMFLIREDPEPAFVLAAIKQHDDANKLAERVVLRTNPVNGVVEILDEGETGPAESPEHPSSMPIPEVPSGPLVGYRAAELESVGIVPLLAKQAVTSATEDELLEVLAGAPAWQADVLLSLAAGVGLDDALDTAGVTSQRSPSATETDIEAALDHPGSRMEFVRIDNDEELRRVLEGSFEAWRTFLHPEQYKYAYRDTYNGAFRLSGGAGTGKTVVALHRARHLARHRDARIVLTTYTTTLADNLRRGLASLDSSVRAAARLGEPGVVVRGIDKLAREALAAADPRVFEQSEPGLLPSDGRSITALGDVEDRALWQEVLDQAGADVPTELARPAFLMSEYRTVILGQEIMTAADYARAPRPGRGTRLGRAQRLAVWKLVESYRRKMAMNRTASFPELAVMAARALITHYEFTGERLADHVVVDEAQDLNAGHWRLLRALVAEGPNDLFICEDSHQRIYGEKTVLSRFGIAIRGRSRRLTLNYRTTAQNLGFAMGLLHGAEVTDLEGDPENTTGYRSAMNGPEPRLRSFTTMTEELDFIASTLQQWQAEPGIERHTIGVLARSARIRDLVQRGLADRGVSLHVVAGSDPPNGSAPSLLTMHRAKGLEFSRVVLAGVNDQQLPSRRALSDMPPDERTEVTDRERFLLYVAATRARDQLIVTWHGQRSGFLPQSIR